MTLSKTSMTSSRLFPSSHAAPVTLYTVTQPQMPRRLWISSTDAEAMSSVTTAIRASMPSAFSISVASPKCRTSPA